MNDDYLSVMDVPELGNLMSSVDRRFRTPPPSDVVANLLKMFPKLPEPVCSVLAHIEHESARVWMAQVIAEATSHAGTHLGLFYSREATAVVTYAHARADLSRDASRELQKYISELN